jgi:MFS family permease
MTGQTSPQPPGRGPTRLLCDSEKPGWAHYKVLLLAWAGWAFDFYDLILYSFLLVPIGEELQLSREMLSWVLGTSLAATALGGVVFGALADRLGRKTVLSLTILTYSLGTFLCGFATGAASLLAFRVLTGLGVGGEWATGQAYVAECFPSRMRGRFGAIMQTGAPLGVGLAAVVSGFLQPLVGWRGCFLLSALPALLVLFIRGGLPESDLWEERQRLAKAGALGPEALALERRNKLLVLFTPPYRRTFLFALVLAILDMSAYWFTYSWLPGYLQSERQLSLAQSALWILLTQTGGFLGYLSFGVVADSLGRRPAYSIYGVIWAVGLTMITLFWQTVVVYPAVILAFMFLVGFGTGMFGGYGPLFAELFPTGIRNTAMGAAFNLARGVQFFTPVAIAVIARQYGLAGGISMAALFALLAGAWVWTFPETKGKRLAAEEG